MMNETRPGKSNMTETDPYGKDLNSPGAKADAGKVRPALVLGGFARALLEVGKIGTYGAKKYTEYGWLTVPDGVNRYDEAMLRHWLAEKAGQSCDPDTDLLHAAHLAWNALARLDLLLRQVEKFSESRLSPEPTADFLKSAGR
jgi:hypothetical protein